MNTTDKQIEQVNESQDIKECQYIRYHERFELVGLKEEDNSNYLNRGCIMDGIICSKCGLHLVKNDKYELNKELVTVFNTRRSVLGCKELLTSGLIVCRFCICHDCKITMLHTDENKSKGISNRRRRQRN